MAWIESHQSLGRHPKTKTLARSLAVTRVAAIGHLHCLWWWAFDFAEDGDLSRFPADEVADEAMWDGDPDDFVTALKVAGFLDKDGKLHDWHRGRHSRGAVSQARREWEGMSKRVRPEVFERDRWTCQACGHQQDAGAVLEVDHVVPIRRDGTNEFSNLQTLCRPCNRRKGGS